MSYLDVRDPKLSRIVSDEPMAKRASGFRFTEGPVWRAQDGVLIFSDIPGDRLYSFDPRSGAVEIFRTPSNKTNGNCLDREGRIVSCEHATRVGVVRQEPDGRMTTLASHYGGLELRQSERRCRGLPPGRRDFTDPPYGRYGGAGVLLGVGIPRAERPPVGRLSRSNSRDGSMIRLVEDFAEPNGLCLAPTSRFSSSTIRRRSTFAGSRWGKTVFPGGEIWAVLEGDEPGVPDGMKVDAEGDAALHRPWRTSCLCAERPKDTRRHPRPRGDRQFQLGRPR